MLYVHCQKISFLDQEVSQNLFHLIVKPEALVRSLHREHSIHILIIIDGRGVVCLEPTCMLNCVSAAHD